jgi:hypothetical protein
MGGLSTGSNTRLALPPSFGRTVFDMSIGYDLTGIRSERVTYLSGPPRHTGAVHSAPPNPWQS